MGETRKKDGKEIALHRGYWKIHPHPREIEKGV